MLKLKKYDIIDFSRGVIKIGKINTIWFIWKASVPTLRYDKTLADYRYDRGADC